jgi:hypothetical protein
LRRLLRRRLLLLLLCEMMADNTTRGCAGDGMMTSHMPAHGADGGTLEAPFCLGTIESKQEHEPKQGHGDRPHSRYRVR